MTYTKLNSVIIYTIKKQADDISFYYTNSRFLRQDKIANFLRMGWGGNVKGTVAF